MKCHQRVSLCTLAIIFAALASAAADDDKNKGPADAKTDEVLKKVGDFFKDAKTLHCDATIESSADQDGKAARQSLVKATVDLQRPNLFSFRSKADKGRAAGFNIVCDGKKLFILSNGRKNYTEGKAPADLSSLAMPMSQLEDTLLVFGILFVNVLQKDAKAALLEGVTKAEHVGMEKVDGKEAHHMKFSQAQFDWELWVAADGPAYVLKVVTIFGGEDGKAKLTETYSNWKVNGEPAKDVFEFKPPEGAKKVDSLGGPVNDK